jgi:hypothetical protein
MKTVPEVVALLREQIKLLIEHEYDKEHIGNARVRQLLLMEDCLNSIGFPAEAEHKTKASLVPYIFQEANYDSISWTEQQADLDHLRAFFELDFMVQNQGHERSEAGTEEFDQYVETSFQAIDQAQAESSN